MIIMPQFETVICQGPGQIIAVCKDSYLTYACGFFTETENDLDLQNNVMSANHVMHNMTLSLWLNDSMLTL